MRVWIVMSEHGTFEEADTEVVGVFTSNDVAEAEANKISSEPACHAFVTGPFEVMEGAASRP